jgi:hypothetical protein
VSEATTPADGRLPLWPFQTCEQVRAWQAYRQALDIDPQHRLDPAVTALEFTRGALGFTGVDRITSRAVSGDQQFVGVGLLGEAGAELTVAVLRLMRLGDGGAQDPWVVTGTEEVSAFSRPGYGAVVTAPLRVGGVINGVDEALRVVVTGPGGATLGTAGPIGIGGADQEWSAVIDLAPAPPGALLTVAVSTGGHLGDVEWFAVTGVRLG